MKLARDITFIVLNESSYPLDYSFFIKYMHLDIRATVCLHNSEFGFIA